MSGRGLQVLQALSAALAALAIGGALRFAVSRETPIGLIAGTIVLAEDQRPVEDAEVVLTPVHGRGHRITGSSSNGSFRFRRVPSGSYRISASSSSHAIADQSVDVAEGEIAAVRLAMTRSKPEFEMNQHQRVFTTRESPTLAVSGYVGSPNGDGATVQVAVYRTRLSQALLADKGADELEQVGRVYDALPALPPGLLHPAGSAAPARLLNLKRPITGADREGFFYQKLDFGHLPTGLYLVEAKLAGKGCCGWLLVTNTAIIVKRARNQLVAFAVDIESGAPARGSKIRVFANGAVVGEKSVDSRGIAELALPRLRRRLPEESSGEDHSDAAGMMTTLAIRGDDEAMVARATYQNEESGLYAVHTYTDRPIYRPGQRISFKGITRLKLDDATNAYAAPPRPYQVPPPTPVQVEMRDKSGERIYQQKLTTNRRGSFFGQVEIDPEAPTGVYELIVNIGGERHTHQITIASYEKPEFAVTVAPEKKRYVVGETVSMTVGAQYFFGAPVAGAKVKYSVYRSPDYTESNAADPSDEDDAGSEAESGPGGADSFYGDVISEGEARLDESGRAVVSFLAAPHPDPEGPQADSYSLSATVVEGADREAFATGEATVVTGDFHVEVATDGYMAAPGETMPSTVTVKDHDGKPVAGVAVNLEYGYQEWKRNRASGSAEYSEHYERAGELRVTTGQNGIASAAITGPRAGELVIKARATDSAGRAIIGRTMLWLAGEKGEDLNTQYSDLSLLTDRKRYRVGDTARILINSGRVGQTVLITIEGDRVYQAQTVTLAHHSTLIRVPVLHDYGSAVFVNAAYISRKHHASSEAELRIALPERRLQVQISADRPAGTGGPARYLPGDRVTYSLRTLDSAGHPVSAELSFGVVDEAIYALKRDDPKALYDEFWPHGLNRVDTQYSFAIEYLGDADKSEPQISARRKFPDTAYWNPTVETDSKGRATITMELPDNLTTWRATATAHTDSTQVGRATEQIIASKEFLVRLETPRFLTERDQSRIVALVHNDTGVRQNVNVHLVSQNLTLTTPAVQNLNVESGQVGQVVWPVTALAAGDARLRVTAWTGKSSSGASFTDGMEKSLPIGPHGRETITTFAGSVSGPHPETEVVHALPGAVAATARLTVRITPSLSGALDGALDYLVGYPYGCTEQTMSRFLPDLLVQRAVRLHGLPAPRGATDLPKMVRSGLSRLGKFQHDKGGWGWWEHDTDSPWMTAYVLYGLAIAQQEGYATRATMLQKAQGAAAEMARSVNTTPDDQAFLLYALALSGDTAHAAAIRPTVMLAKMHGAALGYLTLLDGLLGSRSSAARQALDALQKVDPSTLHWQSSDDETGDWDSTLTTAVALQAMIEGNPRDPRIPAVLRWLMLNRSGDYWYSTRDTSWVIAALCRYLSTQPGYSPGGSVVLRINGKPLRAIALTQEMEREPQVTIRVPASMLRPDKNDVTFERLGGSSPVYYSVEMRQTLDGENAGPAVKSSTSVTIKREYLRLKPLRTGETYALETEATGNTMQSGDHIRVRLTLTAPRPLEYVLVEDPFPSAMQVDERGDSDSIADWSYWWQGVDVRDDRIAFFARKLPKGKSVIEYNLRAQTPGLCHV